MRFAKVIYWLFIPAILGTIILLGSLSGCNNTCNLYSFGTFSNTKISGEQNFEKLVEKLKEVYYSALERLSRWLEDIADWLATYKKDKSACSAKDVEEELDDIEKQGHNAIKEARKTIEDWVHRAEPKEKGTQQGSNFDSKDKQKLELEQDTKNGDQPTDPQTIVHRIIQGIKDKLGLFLADKKLEDKE